MSLISVIIPNRENESPYETIKSLSVQTVPFEVIVVYDEGKGANWARNRGAGLARGDFFLFSDNDIIWEPNALKDLYLTLQSSLFSGYSYGWYTNGKASYCQQPFSASSLKRMNYISTMSLIHKQIFPGFDESLKRLQDWDVWLTLLEHGIEGIYCDKKIFSTKTRNGITSGLEISWDEAERIVREKHGI
jgi:glycosyltransferase involved in cell wall biosynthesis